MKPPAIGFISLLTLCVSVFGGERDYSKNTFPEVTKIAFRQAKEADFVIDYLTHLDQYHLGIGKIEKNFIDSVLLDLEQIEPFFAKQRHKELIVVVFRKNTWDEERRNGKIAEINRSFFRAGFKRVVVQQDYDSGRGIWSDRDNPNMKKIEQDVDGQPQER